MLKLSRIRAEATDWECANGKTRPKAGTCEAESAAFDACREVQ